jgi:pimeloyl-ACP methyl ester carboxylesterase
LTPCHRLGGCIVLPVLDATLKRRFLATAPITAPVTIAFGSRDRLLLRHQSRHLDQLPPSSLAEALPGCGHMPMADDPARVCAVITRSPARAAADSHDTRAA